MDETPQQVNQLVLKALFYPVRRCFQERAGDVTAILDRFSPDEKEQEIIERASSSTIWKDAPQSPESRFLTSIFSKIEPILQKPTKMSFSDNVCHDLGALSILPNYPKPVDACEGSYEQLWKQFVRDYSKIENLNTSSALALLQKYTTFMPVAEELGCDVSLYDHAKILAAIASCIFLADDKAQPYMFFGADFSGIQKFIYTITSRGALKSLRARSFYLEMLNEHAVFEILKRTCLSPANIILSGGGMFTLLLPNTNGIESKTVDVISELNSELYRLHNTKLYIVHGLVGPFGDKNLQDVTEPWQVLGEKISEAKRHKYFAYMRENTDFFEPIHGTSNPKPDLSGGSGRCARCNTENAVLRMVRDGKTNEVIFGCTTCIPEKLDHQECHVCHRYAGLVPLSLHELENESPAEVCLFCANLYHIGEHIHMTKYVVRRRIHENRYVEAKGYINIGRTFYELVKDDAELNSILGDESEEALPEAVWAVNSLKVDNYNKMLPVYPLFVGTYPDMQVENQLIRAKKALLAEREIKKEEMNLREFRTLAACASGDTKLATLRMDVDYLGTVMTKGLPEGSKNLIRIHSLSRQLTLFFKFHLNALMKGEGLQNNVQTKVLADSSPSPRYAVIVYAGGDDLFVVGAWNDIAELAHDIYRCFSAYVAGKITISGGFIMTPHDYPLYMMARMSERAERSAKENKGIHGEKNSIAPFFKSTIFDHNDAVGHAIPWDGVQASYEKIVGLTGALLREGYGTESKAKTFIYHLMTIIKIKKNSGKIYFPRLLYFLSRKEVSQVTKNTLKNTQVFRYLHPALVWLKYLGRKGK